MLTKYPLLLSEMPENQSLNSKGEKKHGGEECPNHIDIFRP